MPPRTHGPTTATSRPGTMVRGPDGYPTGPTAARTIQRPRHNARRRQVCTYPLEHPEPPLTPPHTPTTSPKAQQTTTVAPRPLRAQGRHFRVATSLQTHHARGHPRPSKSPSSPLPFDTYSPTLIPTDTPMTPHGHLRPQPHALPRHTHTNRPCAWSSPCPSKSPPFSSLPSDANSPTPTPRDTNDPQQPLMPPSHVPP